MREKRESKQRRFDLYTGDFEEKRLNEFIEDLTKEGKAREWIVRSLIRSMPAQSTYRGADPAMKGLDRTIVEDLDYTDMENEA